MLFELIMVLAFFRHVYAKCNEVLPNPYNFASIWQLKKPSVDQGKAHCHNFTSLPLAWTILIVAKKTFHITLNNGTGFFRFLKAPAVFKNLCHCKQLLFPDYGLFNSTVLKD